MASTSVGRLLLNDILPPSHQVNGPVNKKEFSAMMVDLAQHDPQKYVDVISRLKTVGDAVTTDLGITVGLDDIAPDYAARDKVLEPALAKIKRLKDPDKRRKLIEDTQQQLLEVTRQHPGQMTPMALSGARGKIPQLMRSVSSPVAVVDDQSRTIPWMISKSYAEGLKAPDTWVALTEARRNAIETYTSVAAPGDLSKTLVNNMTDQIITMPDCGTRNGIAMRESDPDTVSRYDTNGHLITTPGRSDRLIRVRSPMTCEASSGVCQKCYGQGVTGQVPSLGENVGMHAAHAMGEPLTQMALNAKHAVRTAAGEKAVLAGLEGFKQLTEIPQSFFNKATLASRSGEVTSVRQAPQGGHYVNVDAEEHYVPPNLHVRAKRGTQVEAGDALSDGIPRPDEVVAHKGLGAGRDYIVNQLQGLYDRQGIPLDRRHLELLAKTDLNYVRILEPDSRLGVIRGDIVDYNRFRADLAQDAKDTPLDKAVGQMLGDSILHYTAGTMITPSIAQDIRRGGVTSVPVSTNTPAHEPVMKPISRAPLLHPDWMARMGHRHLKNTLLEGAAFGEAANIHGTHPIPAYIVGSEFGKGPGGRY